MKRALSTLCVLVASCATTTVSPNQTHTPNQTEAVEQPRLVRDAYSVQAVGPWQDETTNVDMPWGRLEVNSGWHVDEATGARYSVVYMDWMAPVAQAFDRTPEGIAATFAQLNGSGGARAVREVSAGPHPGYEFEVDAGEQAGFMRAFWYGDTLFFISVFGSGDLPQGGRQFLDSLVLRDSTRTIAIRDDAFELKMTRAAHHETSDVNDNTALHQFIIGDAILCRIFVTRGSFEGVAWKATVDTMRQTFGKGDNRVVSERELDTQLRTHEYVVSRTDDTEETIRLVTNVSRIFLVGAPSKGGRYLSPETSAGCLNSFAPHPAPQSQREIACNKQCGGSKLCADFMKRTRPGPGDDLPGSNYELALQRICFEPFERCKKKCLANGQAR